MKKYSDNYINHSHILKNAVIGFEFEFYMRELSFYKTLEIMNKIFDPVIIKGFRTYHPDFKPSDKEWLISPDLSGGNNMVELVTGPMSYYTAKIYLIKILKFIQDYGYTTDSCAIHFNLSFNDNELNLNDLNVLKMILSIDEDEIYMDFPKRKGNIYAKSIKNIIPYRDYDYNNISINVVKNALTYPTDKYYGVNFLHMNKDKSEQRLEFRYIGGKNYQNDYSKIMKYFNKFILLTNDCVNTDFVPDDVKKLEKYLDTKIKVYNNLSKYDNFLIDFPTVSLQVDQNYDYDIINSSYTKFYEKLYKLVESIDNLENCIVNFHSVTNRIEVVNAKIKTKMPIRNIDLINCVITESIIEKCNIIDTDVYNSQLTKCNIARSSVEFTKVINSTVDGSLLNNCFYMGGYLNGLLTGDNSVFRSGEVGPNGKIDSNVKIINPNDNFFNTKFDDDEDTNYDLKNKK